MILEYQKLQEFVQFIDNLPRIPLLYILDCIICCRIVRRYLSIPSPLISFVFTLFITTVTDNIESYFTSSDFVLFSDCRFFFIFFIIWVLFNFSPYDFVYNLSNILSPAISLFTGLINAKYLSVGIELLLANHNNIVEAFFGGVLISFSKYLSIYTFSRLIKHKMRSIYIILFELSVGGVIYIFMTDITNYNTIFVLKRSDARVLIIILFSIFEIVRNYVKDQFFGSIWSMICYVVSLIIPYYGATWIPNQAEFNKFE